jgi:hypothetical protein
MNHVTIDRDFGMALSVVSVWSEGELMREKFVTEDEAYEFARKIHAAQVLAHFFASFKAWVPDENPKYSDCRGEFPRVQMTQRPLTHSRDVQNFLTALDAYFAAVAVTGIGNNNGGTNMLLAQVHKTAHRVQQAAMRGLLPDVETRKEENRKLNGKAAGRYEEFNATDRRATAEDLSCGWNVCEIVGIREGKSSRIEYRVRYLNGVEKWVPNYAVKGPQEKIEEALERVLQSGNITPLPPIANRQSKEMLVRLTSMMRTWPSPRKADGPEPTEPGSQTVERAA